MSFRATGSALVVVALLSIAAFARTTPPIITDGDFAVTELYTELATEGRLTLGPYSRFGWHHPGPIYFFVQAGPYVLGGRAAASLYATALALNLAALALLGWTLMREARGPLSVLIPAACVLLAWRVPRFLASPWTAHVPILPSLTFVVVCAAVIAGRWRLLPLMLAVGTFVVQTHLALAPMVGALSVVAVAVVLFGRDNGKRPRPAIAFTSIGVLFVLWLPVLLDSILNRGGNVAALWTFFFADPGAGHTFRDALIHWSYGISAVLRPDFSLPWGGHFEPQYLAWTIPFALAQMVALAALAWSDLTSGRRFEGTLAGLALAASASGLWSLTRVRDDILDHELFSLAALGAVNLAIIASAVCRSVFKAWSPRLVVGGNVVTLTIALLLGIVHLQDLTAFERRRSERPAIVASFEAVRDYVSREGVRRPFIDMEGATWGHAVGVVLRLRQADIACAVRDESLSTFTNAFAANGREDAIVTIGTVVRHREAVTRPGNTVLRDREPFVDAIKIAPGRTR